MTSQLQLAPLENKEISEYGSARVKDAAFDAINRLWVRRQSEGLTQKDLAERAGIASETICRNLRGPRNWTLHTLGALAQALNGDVKITVDAIEDAQVNLSNYDAYDDYDDGNYPVAIVREIRFSRPHGAENALPVVRARINAVNATITKLESA